MKFDQQGVLSSYSVICETDVFVLIKDNDNPNFSSITNAAGYTIKSLSKSYDLSNRRVVYQDTMKRFDELCHLDGNFTGFKALTDSQQYFFNNLLLRATKE